MKRELSLRRDRGLEWIEDSVVFEGSIRRSGNSLVITIPSELNRRFLLKDGQRVLIVGLTRKDAGLEGAIKVMLGSFRVRERAYMLRFRVDKDGVDEGSVMEFAERMSYEFYATDYLTREEEDHIEVSMIFGALGAVAVRPRRLEDVERIGDRIRMEGRRLGMRISDMRIKEEMVEYEDIDPSELSRVVSRFKGTDRLSWEWIL